MKIAYVCYWNLLSKDGVANKIGAQVSEWEKAGHEVDVFCLSRSKGVEADREWIRFPFVTPLGRARATRQMIKAVRAARPDFVYLRYDLFVPPPVSLLRAQPSAVEINADDRREARLRRIRTTAASLYNELNRRVLLSSAKGLVCVTHELARSPDFASFGKPTAVIANAVDLDQITPVPPAAGERPRMVFLGSRQQTWHGVDKLFWLAETWPDADFDIIGYEARDLAPPPPNIQIHGVLARHEYEPLIASADVAIGTLALHRKQMTEACPLKVREYLGYGLPVVIAYEDTDFVGRDEWFLHRLPNVESNVREGVAGIKAFVEGVRGRRVPREAVEDLVGAHGKELTRLRFFDRLAGGQAGSSEDS